MKWPSWMVIMDWNIWSSSVKSIEIVFFPPLHKIHGFTNNWRSQSLSWDVMNLSNYPTFFGKFFQLGNHGGCRGWCFWLVASSPGTKKGGFLEAFGEFSRFFFRHDERSTGVVIGVHQIWKHCALGVFNSLDDEKKSQLGGGNSDIYDHFFF